TCARGVKSLRKGPYNKSRHLGSGRSLLRHNPWEPGCENVVSWPQWSNPRGLASIPAGPRYRAADEPGQQKIPGGLVQYSVPVERGLQCVAARQQYGLVLQEPKHRFQPDQFWNLGIPARL